VTIVVLCIDSNSQGSHGSLKVLKFSSHVVDFVPVGLTPDLDDQVASFSAFLV